MAVDFRDNMQKCQEYIQREHPLCLELVTQCTYLIDWVLYLSVENKATYISISLNLDPICVKVMVFGGIYPLKRSHSPDDDEEYDEHESNKEHTNIVQDSNENDDNSDKLSKKSDWLRCVQLWNQTPDPPTTHEEHQPKRASVVEVKKSEGAFHQFEKAKTSTSGNNKPTSTPAASAWWQW
ncbi:hypothetical protein Cgig2_005870 [Carnegiea gigantea]|uniref:Uncharacterized protein n=1 Tax=Carnegiea gigantea TaxID=171969 RepID=A0A9Q1QLP3_9CARY|nr:hypothetical protein Cgig2_005870 [Carnegiea gigantea]